MKKYQHYQIQRQFQVVLPIMILKYHEIVAKKMKSVNVITTEVPLNARAKNIVMQISRIVVVLKAIENATLMKFGLVVIVCQVYR